MPTTYYYGFNVAKPPFDNRLVRQAFALALDRQAFVDLANELDYSQPRLATVFTPPDTLGRDLYGHVGLPFDPDRARELLAQAGYPGGEGLPQVTLAYNALPGHTAMADVAIAMWRDHLGVNVLREEIGDWDAYLERLSADAPQIFRVSWRADYNDPDNFLAVFSWREGPPRGNFFHDEFEGLFEQAAAIGDPAERQALYIEAERIVCQQEAAVIPLFHFHIAE